MQKAFDPQDIRRFNQLNNEVNKALTEFRNEKWQTRLQEIEQEQNPNPMWKLPKILRNKIIKTPPLHENKYAITEEEKSRSTSQKH